MKFVESKEITAVQLRTDLLFKLSHDAKLSCPGTLHLTLAARVAPGLFRSGL